MFLSNSMTCAKLFFLLSLSGFVVYIILALYTFHTAYFTITELQKIESELKFDTDNQDKQRYQKDLKYILLWTKWKSSPFSYLLEGQATFIEQNCPYINCFITDKRNLLNEDYTNFEAVLFNMADLKKWKPKTFPKYRSPAQKYVFVSKQSADTYPICNIKADYFFNWTYTYKFNSDIVSPFIEIHDSNDTTIGPKVNMTWDRNITPTSKELRHKFRSKSKAVIWLSDRCLTRNNRMHYVRALKSSLREFSLTLDIYGKCGSRLCPNDNLTECFKLIEDQYYFYLAFEDTFSEDYVTAEVLRALNNFAVPIVFGSDDYSKFLPPGSYLEVRKTAPESVANSIHYAIRNPAAYYKYFEWRNHYKYYEVQGLGRICDLCQMLNDEEKFSKYSLYQEFRKWWYPRPLQDRCLPISPENQLNYTNIDRNMRI